MAKPSASSSIEEYIAKRDGVTATLIQNWLECPRRARLMVERWTPNFVSMALTFGIIAHNALELVYGIFRKKGAFPNISGILIALDQVVRDFSRDKIGRWSAQQRQDFELIDVQLGALIPAYFMRWGSADAKKKWIALEGLFDIPFCGSRVRGRMDGVFIQNSKPWLFETKTKSVIDESNLLDTLSLDLQLNLYLWALERLLYAKDKNTEKPVGALYNILRRPRIEPRKGEALDDYGRRLSEDIASRPDFYFLRMEVAIDWRTVNEFGSEFTKMVTAFLAWDAAKRPAYTYGMPCVAKYGLCRYVPICHGNNFNPFYRRKEVFEELID